MGASAKPKRGRRAKHHVAADGKQIYGLGHDAKSGRWRVIATNKFFAAPNEAAAIEKFYRMVGRDTSIATISNQVDENGRTRPAAVERMHGGIKFHSWGHLWQHVATEIRKRPTWVAEQTGIEQIGYLTDLRTPEPIPSFAELKKLYKERSTASSGEKTKVLRAWDTFVSMAGIADVLGITPQSAVAFADKYNATGLSPKQQFHTFNGIKRVFSFAIEKARAVDALKKRLGYLKLMKTTDSPNGHPNPQPIERADLHQLLDHATDPRDKAMILLCLNGAYSLGEVVYLKWNDIKNGCIVAHRKKTGKQIRACVLWPNTLEALKKVKRQGAEILSSNVGKGMVAASAQRRFNALADTAGVPHVTGTHMRDGAQTAATRANVTERLINILAGHANPGISDAYVARDPHMVKDATDAVYAHYFGDA